MTYPAIAVRVLIASPSDAREERDRVERTLHEWNASRSAGSGVVLMPVRWETHGVPVLGTDAQDILNAQIVDSADVVIAFFDSRLGMTTARGISGTAEEIERAVADGKAVHVWFSTEPLPREVDLEQVERLRRFQRAMEAAGLIGTYGDVNELAYQVRHAIEHDVEAIINSDKSRLLAGAPTPLDAVSHAAVVAPPPSPPSTQARLRARLTSVGKGSRRLTVVNSGSSPAEKLSVQLITEADRELALHGEQGITLLDGAEYSWNAWLSLADAAPRAVRMTWIDNGQAVTGEQLISETDGLGLSPG